MVTQYPYSLQVQTLAEQSVQTDSGEYLAQITSWQDVSACRDEANGGGKTVQLPDGTAYVYSSLIQLPKSCPVLTSGTPIRVMDSETIRLVGTVSRFQADQLHSRLWV